MKKIDTWLSIQRYVSEVNEISPPTFTGNVEIVARFRERDRQSPRDKRKQRRFRITKVNK